MAVIAEYQNSKYNPNIEILEEEGTRGMERALYVDGVCQSAVWLDPAIRGEPVLKYSGKLREAVQREFPEEKPERILLLGGAGLEVPRALLRDMEEAVITVVEIDPVMKEIAEKYFFLSELTFGGRLKLLMMDAVQFLSESEETYDLIIEDAFCGIKAETDLLTDGAVRNVRSRLSEKGVYIINLVTAISGSDSWPLLMERDILLRFFETVRVYPATPEREKDSLQNCIVAASGRKA